MTGIKENQISVILEVLLDLSIRPVLNDFIILHFLVLVTNYLKVVAFKEVVQPYVFMINGSIVIKILLVGEDIVKDFRISTQVVLVYVRNVVVKS